MDKNTLPELLTPGEVARVFRVDPKTVVRWCKRGLLGSDEWLKTAGGHHRVTRAAVLRLLQEDQDERDKLLAG